MALAAQFLREMQSRSEFLSSIEAAAVWQGSYGGHRPERDHHQDSTGVDF